MPFVANWPPTQMSYKRRHLAKNDVLYRKSHFWTNAMSGRVLFLVGVQSLLSCHALQQFPKPDIISELMTRNDCLSLGSHQSCFHFETRCQSHLLPTLILTILTRPKSSTVVLKSTSMFLIFRWSRARGAIPANKLQNIAST
jgi:hypothetical protein